MSPGPAAPTANSKSSWPRALTRRNGCGHAPGAAPPRKDPETGRGTPRRPAGIFATHLAAAQAIGTGIGAHVTAYQLARLKPGGLGTGPVGIGRDDLGTIAAIENTALDDRRAVAVVGMAGRGGLFGDLPHPVGPVDFDDAQDLGQVGSIDISHLGPAITVEVGNASNRQPAMALA